MGARSHHPANVCGGSNSAFADNRTIVGYFGCQPFGHIQINLECRQIAIVDSNKSGANAKRSIQFSFIMNFDQAINPDLIGYRLEPFQFVVRERCHNQ